MPVGRISRYSYLLVVIRSEIGSLVQAIWVNGGPIVDVGDGGVDRRLELRPSEYQEAIDSKKRIPSSDLSVQVAMGSFD